MSKTGANLVSRSCATPPAAMLTGPGNRRKIGTEPSAEGGRFRLPGAAGRPDPDVETREMTLNGGRFPRRGRQTVTKRSEEHTSELQSLRHLVCRLLLGKNTDKSATMALRESARVMPHGSNGSSRACLICFFFLTRGPPPALPPSPRQPFLW